MDRKRLLSTLAKVGFSAGATGYLVYRARQDEGFMELAGGEKNWPILLLALPLCLAAVTITILRWHMLVRTLDLAFPLRDALRSGFVGYMINLLPLGLVGGDSFKAVMLIHHNPRRKTEAVATVVVDRAIGLYALLLLAAIASLLLPRETLARLDDTDRQVIQRLVSVVQISAVISTAGLVLIMIPAVTHSRLWDRLEHTPLIGAVLHKLVGAMRTYQRRPGVLVVSVAVSLAIHLLYATAVVAISRSIGIAPEHWPALGSIYVVVPPSMIAGALPIGAYEVTITLLFRAISPPGAPPNVGLIIAVCYRLIQICIASIGMVYWLTSRGEVREILHEAEEAPPEDLIDETNRGDSQEPLAAGL